LDLDVVAQGFGHVVHRERGHGYGGERFHFHTGFMAHGHFGADVQAVRVIQVSHNSTCHWKMSLCAALAQSALKPCWIE